MCISYLSFSLSTLTSKYHTFPSCLLWSAQRGVTLNPSLGLTRCELKKLKNSKVSLCPPLPNLRAALQPQQGTETVPRGLKRQLKPQARQAHPLKLKLTRGALTTLAAGLVSSASWGWSQFTCRCACLPASLHGKCVCISVWRERRIIIKSPAPAWTLMYTPSCMWSVSQVSVKWLQNSISLFLLLDSVLSSLEEISCQVSNCRSVSFYDLSVCFLRKQKWRFIC